MELLDAGVLVFADEDVAGGGDREAGRGFELAVAGAFGTEAEEEVAARVELEDLVFGRVGDPDVAEGVEGDAVGTAQGRVVATTGDRLQQGACFAELEDLVGTGVRDPKRPARSRGYSPRFDESGVGDLGEEGARGG